MAASDAGSSVTKQEEGPVKVARARVWRACEVCRKRKIKCDGQEPCAYCISSGKACSFKEINDNAAGARQYAITVDNRLTRVEETMQKLMPMAKAFESWLRTADPNLPFLKNTETDNPPPLSLVPSISNLSATSPSSEGPYRPSKEVEELSHYPSAVPGGAPSRNPSNDNMEEEAVDSTRDRWSDRFSFVAKDSYGNLRYIGGASSMMFVEALNSLHETAQLDASPESSSSDVMSKAAVDAELPFFKRNKKFRPVEALPLPEKLVFPPHHVADELVSAYFTHIHHTFPILHQQSFINRYIRVMEARQTDRRNGDHAFLSCLFAVFACASSLNSKQNSLTSSARDKSPVVTIAEFAGMDMYEQSQLMYWLASGTNQMELIQSLALQAICNASWNTLATSWINAGQALRRAQDLGLHRSPRRLPLNSLEKEIRRRVWWCVYGLDRVLSMALGRPSGTSDDDCDTELPAEVDDGHLQSTSDGNAASPGGSFMTGFISLIQIYVIAGKIVRKIQSSRIDDPTKDDQMTRTVRQLDRELSEWVENLPHNVRYAANDRKNPKMLALCLIAFFVYYSAIINLHRPFIPDSSTSSNDMTSLGQCVNAAKSCIRIGDMVKEMLPTSHHLAFAVQYITLSGVLLLRCVAYVNQPDLVSAVIVDAEKCVELLHGMEETWPGARRCREIVSDLLVVVKAKHYGGPLALESIQTVRNNQGAGPVPSEPSQGKRKMPAEFDSRDNHSNESHSRPRLEEHESNVWAPPQSQSQSDRSINNGFVGSASGMHNQTEITDSVTPHRVSNVRTPVDRSPTEYHHHQPRHSEVSILPNSTGSFTPQYLPSIPMQQSEHPRISLDLNALSAGREIDGLPFSGYDFLGDDLYALLGSVFKPPNQQIPEQFEQNGQLLWQAYGQAGEHLGQEPQFRCYDGQPGPSRS